MNRHRAAAQSCSAADLFSPADCRWRHTDLPAHSRCSLSPPLPIPDGPAACNPSAFSAAVSPLYHPVGRTSRADDGKYRPEFRRRYALRPVHPGLSSATAASGQSWRWSHLLPRNRSTADGRLRSESTRYQRRSSRHGSARSWRFPSPADRSPPCTSAY
ncbi:hypothetical protein D3C72_1376810 [compost metagenome]